MEPEDRLIVVLLEIAHYSNFPGSIAGCAGGTGDSKASLNTKCFTNKPKKVFPLPGYKDMRQKRFLSKSIETLNNKRQSIKKVFVP